MVSGMKAYFKRLSENSVQLYGFLSLSMSCYDNVFLFLKLMISVTFEDD